MADPARRRLAAETHRETGLTSVFQGRQAPASPGKG